MKTKYFLNFQETYDANLNNKVVQNNYFQYKIRFKISLQPPLSLKFYQKRIQMIAKLQTEFNGKFTKLQQISEDFGKNQFLLTYQNFNINLKRSYKNILNEALIQKKMLEIVKILINNKIQPQIDVNHFGFNQKMQIKYLLLPNYKQITQNKQLIKNQSQLLLKIKKFIKIFIFTDRKDSLNQNDKSSVKKSDRDFNEYNKKFQQKISYYENKVLQNKMKGNQFNFFNKFKRSKKLSAYFAQQNISLSSSSTNSNKKSDKHMKPVNLDRNKFFSTKSQQYIQPKNQKLNFKQVDFLIKIKSLHLQKNTKDLSSQTSQSHQTQDPQRKDHMKQNKLTNSLIIQEKNQNNQKIKHHKSSFGDYSNYAIQNIDKQKKLKSRISFALQKSQNTLKIYEKYLVKLKKKKQPINT